MQLRCLSLPAAARGQLLNVVCQALGLDDAWFIQAYPDIQLEPGVRPDPPDKCCICSVAAFAFCLFSQLLLRGVMLIAAQLSRPCS